MAGLFTAKYPGRCDGNGCRIEEGDRIGYADGYDKPLCETCWSGSKDPEPGGQVCPACWTIHAGACL